jgi:hypothetical protein
VARDDLSSRAGDSYGGGDVFFKAPFHAGLDIEGEGGALALEPVSPRSELWFG